MNEGLVVEEIRIKGFRSYESFVLKPDSRLTVLVGPNAAGKTNILEAIQLTTAAESFRSPLWKDLISWGEEYSYVSLSAVNEGRLVEIKMFIDRRNGRREYQVNGSRKKRLSEVRGIIPCVLFTPDDLSLVKGPAENRRTLIDSLGDQLSPMYESLRKEYSRVVRQRNSALRNDESNELIQSFNTTFFALGGKFTSHRARLVVRVKKKAEDIYQKVSDGESLEIKYLTPWCSSLVDPAAAEMIKESLIHETNRVQAEEKGRKTTLCGPHKDDILFLINGRKARDFASQGQQRTIALAWKLAEVEVISEVAGVPPILLLDDVMSELDEYRRRELALVAGMRAQTIFTTTNIGYFDEALLSRAKVVDIP
jgi:DNA replication and repair protein RecF